MNNLLINSWFTLIMLLVSGLGLVVTLTESKIGEQTVFWLIAVILGNIAFDIAQIRRRGINEEANKK